MLSPQDHVSALRAQRAAVGDASVRRVRHGIRDQILVMAFSLALSVGLAVVLAVLPATVMGRP